MAEGERARARARARAREECYSLILALPEAKPLESIYRSPHIHPLVAVGEPLHYGSHHRAFWPLWLDSHSREMIELANFP